jgi:hypothetical protein
LYDSADFDVGNSRGDVHVQAAGDTLHLFTNWIYNGTILLPEANEDHNDTFTFEASCQLALKDAQRGLPITVQHQWIKKEGETSCVEGMEIPQLRMARLIGLYKFAQDWNIETLKDDVLKSFAISIKVANTLPDWGILYKASSVVGKSELRDFLVELFLMNWSAKISESFCKAPASQKHSGFASLMLHKITRQQEASLRKKDQAKKLCDIKTQISLETERELARVKKSLAEAQAKIIVLGQKKRPAAEKKPAVKQEPTAKEKPAAVRKQTAKTKRAREEEDVVDRSESFRQSLKRPRRELRPRTGGNLKLES